MWQIKAPYPAWIACPASWIGSQPPNSLNCLPRSPCLSQLVALIHSLQLQALPVPGSSIMCYELQSAAFILLPGGRGIPKFEGKTHCRYTISSCTCVNNSCATLLGNVFNENITVAIKALDLSFFSFSFSASFLSSLDNLVSAIFLRGAIHGNKLVAILTYIL